MGFIKSKRLYPYFYLKENPRYDNDDSLNYTCKSHYNTDCPFGCMSQV